MNSNTKKMPLIFIGRGSPNNALEKNKYTLAWKSLSEKIKKPKAILIISSNWITQETGITAMEKPNIIHDLEDGFSDELFSFWYDAKGDPELAKTIKERITNTKIILVKDQWGLDSGAWTVLNQMYPNADIPVLQLSIDYYKTPTKHYELGKQLSFLRDEGVLIIGSGNIVYNYTKGDFFNPEGFYPWAKSFDNFVKVNLIDNDHKSLINYQEFGKDALESVPIPEFYYPLLYIIGATREDDEVSFPVEDIIFGSLSMRSVLFE